MQLGRYCKEKIRKWWPFECKTKTMGLHVFFPTNYAPSLKLTAKAPGNGWLEYYIVSFVGQRPYYFQGRTCCKFFSKCHPSNLNEIHKKQTGTSGEVNIFMNIEGFFRNANVFVPGNEALVKGVLNHHCPLIIS